MKLKPKILCQKQIWDECGYSDFIKALGEYFEIREVSVIPFTDVLDPEPDFEPCLVFGAGRFIDIARSRGWHTFDSFEPVEEQYYPRELWLNGDHRRVTLEEFDKMGSSIVSTIGVFVKPVREKLFTGCVVQTGTPIQDQVQMSTTNVDDLAKEMIIYSPVRPICNEYRMIIIGGKLITGSLYKVRVTAMYREYIECVHHGDITDFFDKHGIPEGFSGTIDLAVVEDGSILIIEMNNLNSAGIYDSDVRAITTALLNLVEN